MTWMQPGDPAAHVGIGFKPRAEATGPGEMLSRVVEWT